MTSNILSTWIVNDSESERSFFPQAGRMNSDNPAVHEMYWRCVLNFYACASRSNPDGDVHFILFTNRPVDERYRAQLAALQVEIVIVPLNHLPPAGYFGSWRNQFYILDILEYLAKRPGDFSCAVLDSDCIVLRPLAKMFEEIERQEALLYIIDYRETAKINGLSREDMKVIFEEFDKAPTSSVPNYYGGEFFAATRSAIVKMNKLAETVWQDCLERAAQGRMRFNEEAHLLSYLYFHFGFKPRTGNAFISRLWTQFGYINVKPSDIDLPIWHLPGEKRFGLRRLYKEAQCKDSWFWTQNPDEPWRRRIGRLVGVPRNSVGKQIFDITERIRARVGLH